MLKRRRLLQQKSESLEDQYFVAIRPRLYELHAHYHQSGSREDHTLAEHLDSACQFVLTVSKIAQVPEDKRGCILAATAVHDLNKLDSKHRNVKTLARDRSFLEEQLERVGVRSLVKTDEDLELVRKLIERHSGHNVSDGTRFLPEDPNIAKWAAMLVGGDLFDLGIEEEKRIRKVENELTVAFGRPSHLFKITLSEDRGYLTALLLSACEDVLNDRGLHTLAINPDSQIFEGPTFPEDDLTIEIAKRWQKRIDRVFGGNVEELIKPLPRGIVINAEAIKQNPQETLECVSKLLANKFSSYKVSKVSEDIQKHCENPEAIENAAKFGLVPVCNAEEFAISEGLKAIYNCYSAVNIPQQEAWKRIAKSVGISDEQLSVLEAFDPRYGRCLLAATGVSGGIDTILQALEEVFSLYETQSLEVSQDLINATNRFLNLGKPQNVGISELTQYIESKPDERSSLGSTQGTASKLKKPEMPPETKVQMFSNRLRGGISGDPVRYADSITALGYKLMAVGANFPKASKQAPLYLHFSLPKGSSAAIRAMWRKWMHDTAATNAEGGTVTFDELQLYRDGILTFKENKVVGLALPKRPEFSYSTVTIPVLWGDANNSVALLKSLRLALEISLALDVQFPFILSSNLEVEQGWDVFGRVEGIPSSLQPLLGNGIYYQEQAQPRDPTISVTADQVLNRLRCIGKLTVSVASLQKKDDCLYDLARSAQRPLDLYHVLLRWILREQDDPNLEAVWTRLKEPLTTLLESLMSEEHDRVSGYLKKAAYIAEVGKLRGSSFKRTAQVEPFSAFIKAVRSRKSHMDWDTIFAALVQDYHTRLDRIREHGVGATKYEQIKEFYDVLRQLFDDVYHSRSERLLTDSKTLEAAYLFFLQDARKELKAQSADKADSQV